MNLALIGNPGLRSAIQQNLVSFPSQIPALMRGGETHERLAQLYFVSGWPTTALCERFGLNKSAVWKLLSDWKTRAVAAGYIQAIHPEALAALVPEEDFRRPDPVEHPEPDSDLRFPMPAWKVEKMALAPQPSRTVSRSV